MKTNIVTLRPDRLNFPLEECPVGRLSSAVFVIVGDIPDDIEGMSVVVEYMDNQTKRHYIAHATRQADGTFRAYIAPAYFPAVSNALKYHVVGEDEHQHPRWLGSGLLRILDNPADGSAVIPDILPRNLYAYNPTTGLYYKVVAEVNELGEVTVNVDQEGIAL